MNAEFNSRAFAEQSQAYRRQWLHRDGTAVSFEAAAPSVDEMLEQVIAEPGFLSLAERQVFRTEVLNYEREYHERFRFGEAYEEANGRVILTFNATNPNIEFMGILNKCFKRVRLYQEKNKKSKQEIKARLS